MSNVLIKDLKDVLSCMNKHCMKENKDVDKQIPLIQTKIKPLYVKMTDIRTRYESKKISEAEYKKLTDKVLKDIRAISDKFEMTPVILKRNTCTATKCQPETMRQFKTLDKLYTDSCKKNKKMCTIAKTTKTLAKQQKISGNDLSKFRMLELKSER